MSKYGDVEAGEEYKASDDAENQALLPPTPESGREPDTDRPARSSTCSRICYRPRVQLSVAYLGGIFTAGLIQLLLCPPQWFSAGGVGGDVVHHVIEDLVPPYVGSSEVHHYPPTSPTNVFPSLFPTSVGHAGPTPTGAEPALVATAPSYPLHTGAAHLVAPSFTKGSEEEGSFDLFRHWGNLSPWFSVEKDAFGLDSSPGAPDTCRITGLHLLHRHGARYPTGWGEFTACALLHNVFLISGVLRSASYGGPANFSARLNKAAAGWNASGDLAFMNDW